MKNKSKTQVRHKSSKKEVVKETLFEKAERFFKNRQQLFQIVPIVLTLVFSLLLFNPDVSYGGDDSSYIQNSFNFLKGTAFPSYQGPLYPMLLSVFISIFGVNLIVLKLVSVILAAGAIYFIYKFFASIGNYTVATLAAMISSVSYLLNTYAGSTYSEPFFTFLQALFLYLLVISLNRWKQEPATIKTRWKSALILALLTFSLFQTRTVAIVTIPVALLILIFEREYLGALLYSGSTALILVITGLYKKLVWGASSTSFTNQLDSLLLKNFYKPAEGQEDFAGMIKRFWVNSELYFSKHLGRMTGFKTYDALTRSTTATVFFYLLIVLGALIIWKKQKNFRYLLLYLAAMIGASFLMLQTTWDQERIIMIYFPYILGFFAWVLYTLLSGERARKIQWILPALALILFISVSVQTLQRIDGDSFSTKFKSGTFSTYTPDWQNYMLASRWAAENLPDSAVVICRKPQMSWIAAGGEDIFKGIFRVDYNIPDSAVALFRSMGATHVLMANLRINPKMKTDRTITTIRNSLALINMRYPAALTLLKEIGTDEKAYIFKLDFSERMNQKEYLDNLDAALIVNPRNKQVSSIKSNYYFSNQQFDQALKYLDFSLAYYADDSDLHYSKGLCLFQQNNYAEALASFNKATKYKPDYDQAWYNAAVCSFYLKKYDEARQQLSQAKKYGFKGSTQALDAELARIH